MDEQPMGAEPMDHLEANGFRFAYLDSGGDGGDGDGEPVIFMHAGAGNSHCWVHQVAAFEEPTAGGPGLRCVRFDLRGRGGSRGDGENDGTMADDLEAIADALGIERFHLIAHALGGFPAFDVALAHPERVRSLVLSQSIAVLGSSRYDELRRGLMKIRPGMPVEERELGDSYRARDPEGTRRWLAMEALNHPPPSGRQQLRRDLSLEDLEGVAIPVLFIAGHEDLYAPPEMVRLMAERVPGAQTVVLDAGHSAYWEQPEQWNAAVLDFIAAHRS